MAEIETLSCETETKAKMLTPENEMRPMSHLHIFSRRDRDKTLLNLETEMFDTECATPSPPSPMLSTPQSWAFHAIAFRQSMRPHLAYIVCVTDYCRGYNNNNNNV